MMCMYQKDEIIRAPDGTVEHMSFTKPDEEASFVRALRNIGLLYAHAGTVIFKITMTPTTSGNPDRVYSRRGWYGTTSD